MIDYYEHIEGYREGSLSPEVHQQMTAAMSNDKVLKQAVEDYPIARMISESLIEDEVRGVLAETQKIEPKGKAKRGKSGPWIIIITLLAALAVSYYQWERHSKQEVIHKRIMASSYEPPAPYKGTRGTSEIGNDVNMINGIKAFDLRRFKESKAILEELTPKTDNIYYYLAHIALIENKIGLAKDYEKNITTPKFKKELMIYLSQF